VHYSGSSLDPELNAKVVDEVREHGKRLTSTPLYRVRRNDDPSAFYEMLAYATKHSGVLVTVTTNGVSMKKSRIEKMLDAGVAFVDISIDAFSPETYAKIRVNGDLNVTRANVLKLIAMSKERGSKTKVWSAT